MKSKTLIEKQMTRKKSSDVVETIISAKKNENWFEVAEVLSGPRRKRLDINLNDIDAGSEVGDVIVVPGKVLSQGEVTKKIKVVALGFSEVAKEKLLSSKCDVLTILEEIKKNPEAKGIKIFKK